MKWKCGWQCYQGSESLLWDAKKREKWLSQSDLKRKQFVMWLVLKNTYHSFPYNNRAGPRPSPAAVNRPDRFTSDYWLHQFTKKTYDRRIVKRWLWWKFPHFILVIFVHYIFDSTYKKNLSPHPPWTVSSVQARVLYQRSGSLRVLCSTLFVGCLAGKNSLSAKEKLRNCS